MKAKAKGKGKWNAKAKAFRRGCGAGVLALLCAMMPLGGCAAPAPAPESVSETRLLMDTVCTITLYGQNADRPLLTECLDLCFSYETLLSRTWEGSDIWRINHAGGQPVDVDPRTAEVLRAALAFGDLSGGMFDITIGRVSSLWAFGGGGAGSGAVPPGDELEEALATVDYRQVTVSGNTVQLAQAEAWLDLGGIAKGYIADQLAAFLRERSVGGAVINLGGNVVTVGRKPDGSLWRVGVKEPFGEEGALLGILSTGEGSVVTSGIYERHFVEGGVHYHHILDPATGFPVQNDVVSVTVISENSMEGDALSTIFLLVGSEAALALLESLPGVTGALVLRGDGELIPWGEIAFESAPAHAKGTK
ncbi:MAG: FAD:protein FMN transferase [Oscillospiraceae bacterium]|nr:FAD:protein FMN transferase [Oscillospiraceae bacterium]